MKKKIKSALLIHYYFPPIHSIGVLRNFYLAKEFHKRFETVKVLTTSNQNILPSSSMQGLETMDVEILKTKDYRSKRSQSMHFDEKKKKNALFQFARRMIDSYPLNILIGEGGSTYIKEGIKKGSEFLKQNPQAFIFTSFRPYADLYIGAQLKKKFPNVKWVVDFRDLHVDPMYKNVNFPNFQIRKNKNLLSNAEFITTISNGLGSKLAKYNKEVLTIYNGIHKRAKKQKRKSEKFNICYTGSLFGDKRDPSPLLEWLSNQKNNIDHGNIEIHYAGKDGALFQDYVDKYGLKNSFINHGMITHTEAKKLQERSHINLLLTSVTKGYEGVLTGKLFEYLGGTSPILAIVKGGRDKELESILRQTEAGIVISDGNDWQSKFSSWYLAWVNKNLITIDQNKVQSLFSWEKSVDQLIAKLEFNEL